MFKYGAIEVLGFHISGFNDSPVSCPWLPLQDGLNVLYGLNGAGKSLIIDTLTDTLMRSASARSNVLSATLVLRLTDDGFFRKDDEGRKTTDAYPKGVCEEIASELIPLFKSFARPGEEVWLEYESYWHEGRRFEACAGLEDRLYDELITGFLQVGLPDPNDEDELILELMSQRIIGLENPRTTFYTGWVMMGMPESEFPLITRTIEQYWDPKHSEAFKYGMIEPFANSNEGIIDKDAAKQAQELFCFTGQNWEVRDPVCKVAGNKSFDANLSTSELLVEVHRRHDKTKGSGKTPTTPLSAAVESITAALASELAIQDVKEPDNRILRELAEQTQHLPWTPLEDNEELSEENGLSVVCKMLAQIANKRYAQLLIDAPVLEVMIGTIETWLSGKGLKWGARRSANSAWVPLEHLSEAERRWASIAIELALQLHPSGFLIIDEPERGLHRSAEAFMAKGLLELANELGMCVVAASHSPELLNAPNTSIHVVRRADQGLNQNRQVHPLTSADREMLLEIGLLPSDLLRRQRGLLLVEGEHDEALWNTFLGDKLRDLRVEIIPIRGAGRLNATLDSRVLYEFTDAHLFVMLDALNCETVTTIWDEACKRAKTHSAQMAAEYAARELSALRPDEAKALSAWASRALQLGLEGRHTPMTLNAPDVLDYLPVDSFVQGATSWQELREELSLSMGGKQPSGGDFKKWICSAKGADLSTQHIRDVAEEMNSIPVEFSDRFSQIQHVLNV